MSFEWPRIHKWEERLEQEITDAVYEIVFDHYNISELTELSENDIAELEEFRTHELGEYSPYQMGFSNLINMHESETWEMNEGNGELDDE